MRVLSRLRPYIGIALILTLALLMRLAVLWRLGPGYTLESDDLSYVNSGITFLQTGQVTMHGVLSAQILPGMTWLIALFALIFGTGTTLWLALKLFWILMGLVCILGVYRLVRMYADELCACIAAAFFLAPDFAWMDNLILTETPFQLCFIGLFYYSLRLTDTGHNKYFGGIISCYMAGVLLRPAIGIFPLFLFGFLLLRGYSFKRMLRQGLIALCVLLVFLVPWTIRNYQLFGAFIPLTYGTGNPLLLGTYQGEGYPPETVPSAEQAAELKKYADTPYLWRYHKLELDGELARERMKLWWDMNPAAMLKSYLLAKPKIMLTSSFYWREFRYFPRSLNVTLRKVDLTLAVLGLLALLFTKRLRQETLFVLANYLFQVGLYCWTFAFDRYAQTLYFMRFVLLGWGLYAILNTVIAWRKRNEQTKQIDSGS